MSSSRSGVIPRGEPVVKLLAVSRRGTDWFDARLGLRSTLLPMMRHPIPRESGGAYGLVVRLRRCRCSPSSWSRS